MLTKEAKSRYNKRVVSILKKMVYIGVTGITSADDSEILYQHFLEQCEVEKISFMRGVLVSDKVLNGVSTSNRYVRKNDLSTIFSEAHKTHNLVHYNTQNPQNLYYEMCDVLDWTPNLSGFQLNVFQPDIFQVIEFLSRFPDQHMVFQIKAKYFDGDDNNVSKVLHNLVRVYGGIFDTFLVEQSDIDLGRTRKIVEILDDLVGKESVGVAGGLSPSSVASLKDLVTTYPEISIGAESGLRDENDRFVLDKAKEYISKAVSLYV
jgi:phosphoribosylanthranilate isomerase